MGRAASIVLLVALGALAVVLRRPPAPPSATPSTPVARPTPDVPAVSTSPAPPAYAVEAEESGVRATLAGGASLGLELDEITVGGQVVARGGPASSRRDGPTLTLTRPGVVERYSFRDAEFEQDFILDTLPPARGEIVVTERLLVDAPLPDTDPAPALNVGAFVISRAVAVDAGGRRRPLDLALAGGRLKISVPEDWVRDAALPIVIDPVV